MSISEIQDAVETLDLFDERSASPSDYKKVLYATLGKTQVCRAAIDNILTYNSIKQQISKEIRFGGERHGMKQSVNISKRMKNKNTSPSESHSGSQSEASKQHQQQKQGRSRHGIGTELASKNNNENSSRSRSGNMQQSKTSAQNSIPQYGITSRSNMTASQSHGSHTTSGRSTNVCKIDKAFSGGILKCETEKGLEPIYASSDMSQLERLKSLVEHSYSDLKDSAKNMGMSLKELLKQYTEMASNMDDNAAKAYSKMLQQLSERYSKANNEMVRIQLYHLIDSFKASVNRASHEHRLLSENDLEKLLNESKKTILALSKQELNKNMENIRKLEPDKSLVTQVERIFQQLHVKKANTITMHRSKAINMRKTAKYAMRTGVPMYIYYNKKKPRKVDFYVLADVSGSMSEELPYVLATVEAARKVLGKRGKVFTFVDKVYPLEKTPLGGYTNFGGILENIQRYIPDKSVPIIMFTDVRRGYGASPAHVIEKLRKMGYKVYVLDPEKLYEALEGDSEFQYLPREISYTVPTVQDMAKAVAEILQREGA
ncbi:MAG: VWA domain-containing protein [Crenarchaeota archaeon]|nr:VWA domain-containing protein [Thermoproteota archaeon]